MVGFEVRTSFSHRLIREPRADGFEVRKEFDRRVRVVRSALHLHVASTLSAYTPCRCDVKLHLHSRTSNSLRNAKGMSAGNSTDECERSAARCRKSRGDGGRCQPAEYLNSMRGRISPCSGRDCVKSLWPSYMGLHHQRTGHCR